jgi:phosphoesterase RecJ-like protein
MNFPLAREIASKIKAASRVVLATHAEPDGDAVASVLAMAHGLRAWGRAHAMWPLPAIPRRYSFLPGFNELVEAEAPAKAVCPKRWRPTAAAAVPS